MIDVTLPSLSKRCVLVVDDDRDLRDSIGHVLRDEGFRVAYAENGQVALAMLHAGLRPQAILLDLWMPVVDGWQFRRELERVPGFAPIPVVVLTAARGVDGALLGVRAVLTKPIRGEALMAALAACCGP